MLQFVTDDETLTWAAATQAQKVRANIIIALCNQTLAALPKTALTDALTIAPDSGFMALSFEGRGGASKEASYVVSKNNDGDITISLRDRRMESAATITKPDGEFEDVAFGKESHVDYSLNLTIPKANLDKLANAEWSKYDHAPVEGSDNGTTAGRLNAASIVPDAYRFEGRVEVKVTAHLDKP